MSEQFFISGSPRNPGNDPVSIEADLPPKSAMNASLQQAPIPVEKEPDVVILTPGSPIVNPQEYKVPVFDSVKTVHDVKSSNNSNEDQEVTPAGSADIENKVEMKISEMLEMKSSGKSGSWASNYLTSIGLSQKPIKINLSSKKKFNTAPAESIPNSAAKQNTQSKNSNELLTNLLNQPENLAAITSNQSLQTKQAVTNPTHSTGQLKETNNFTESLKEQLIGTTNQLKQTEQLISIPTFPSLVPTHIHSETPEFESTNFDNNSGPYSNSCHNYDNGHSLQVTSLVEYDRNREVHYRPVEDKFYLDKVEEFLAKVSQDRYQKSNYYKHRSNNEPKAKKRSLSPLQHHDTGYNDTEKEHDIRRANKLQNSNYADTKYYKVDKEYLKHAKYRDAELEHRYGYKFNYTERYNEYKHYDNRGRTSTCKQSFNYYTERSRQHDHQYVSKNRTNTFVNAKFYEDKYNIHENSTHSKIQENKIPKAGNRSNSSSSEINLTRSPKYIINHAKGNTPTYKKRKRCNSCNPADDYRECSSRHSLKITKDKKNKRESRESSSSSINSEYLSELPVHKPKTKKYKQISESRQRSGSNLSESSLKKRAGSPCQTPPTKKHKPIKNSEKIQAKSPRKILHTKKYILNRKSRATCSSSSHSEINGDELSRVVLKSHKTIKSKSRSSNSTSSERSTLVQEKNLHKSLRDTLKAQDSRRKVKISTSNTKDNCKSNLSRQENENSKTKTKKIKSNDLSVKIQESSPYKLKNKQKNRNKPIEYEDKYKTKIKTPDGKKISIVAKDIKSKNKIKNTILESLMSNDKESKSSLITQKIKASLTPSTSTNSFKEEDSKLNQNTFVKSVVQIKENIHEKMNEKEENFDLRSKLSRKGVLDKYFSNECNNTLENDLNTRENLVITVANQEQEEIEYRDFKLEETYKKKTEMKSKAKKCKKKKLKLVISVVCENSEDDEFNSSTYRNRSEDGSIDKKISNESTSLGEELSFLDDFNIDEIVDSLTHNKNDVNDITIDSCVLMNDCDESNDDSNASTVHLEELCDINKDFTDIDEEHIKREDNLKVIENNNMIGGVQRSDTINFTKKSNNDVVTKTITQTKADDRESSTLLTQGTFEIKQEVLDSKIIQNNLFKSDNQDVFVNKSKKKLDNKETITEKNTHDITIRNEINEKSEQINVIPVIKEEPTEKAQVKGIKSSESRSESNSMVIEIKEEPEENLYTKRNIGSSESKSNGIPVIEIKEEPEDICDKRNFGGNENIINGIVPVIEITEKAEKIYNKRNIGSNECKSNGIIPVIEIKEEPEDINDKRKIESYEIESSCQKTQINIIEIKEKAVERTRRKDTRLEKKPNKVSCLEDVILKSHTDIKEEPVGDKLIDKMTIEWNKNKDLSQKLNKTPKTNEGNVKTFARNVNTQEIGTGKELQNNGIESRNQDTVHSDKNGKISEAHQKVENVICVSVVKDRALSPIHKEETKPQEKKNNDHEHVSAVQIKIETQEEVVTELLNEHVVLDDIVQKTSKEIPGASTNSFNTEKSATNAAFKHDKIPLIKECDKLEKMQETIEDSTKNKGTSDACITDTIKLTVNLSCSERADTDNLVSLSGNNPSIPKKDKISESVTGNNFQSDPETIESHILKKAQILSSNGKNYKTETVTKSLEEETVNSYLTIGSKPMQSPSNKQEQKTNNNNTKNIILESETVNKLLKKESESKIKTKILTPAINSLQVDYKWRKKLEINLSECLREPYKCTKVVHIGKFSRIFQCEGAKDQKYIVKSLSKLGERHFRGQERLLLSLQRDEPKENLHFVHFVSELAIDGRYCFVMDYYPKNLSELLRKKIALHVYDVQRLSRQLIEALMILKKHKIIHSDINPGHILLNSTNDRLKLCGFDGAYRVEEANSFLIIGVVNYRAPEIILGYSAGYGIDVWAAALVMFEMATARKLFPGYYDNDILFKQMCTVGYVPLDMINQSRFRDKHFIGSRFMRRFNRSPKQQPYYTVLSENQIYKNNIMKSTVYTTYIKQWSKCITKRQMEEEMVKLDMFTGLLNQMLVIHPNNRLPVEFVYANNFLRNSDFHYV